MSQQAPSSPGSAARPAHGWAHALAAVLGGLVVMAVVAALGLWAAGAADLPDGGFLPVVAALVVMAAGGTVEVAGEAGLIAETRAGLTALPLSVSLVGALTVAAGFLRPLRHRAVASARELAGWAARLAVLWLLALIGLSALARHTFTIPIEDPTGGFLEELLDAGPRVGFRTDLPLTLVFGLLWLAAVLALAVLVSRGAPLPARLLRFQESVRPAAYAMVALLLAYVAGGIVIGIVVALTRDSTADTFAVIFLGLPNLVWLALTIGLGASWEGRVEGPFGLPMPQLLDEVLRTGGMSRLDLSTLTERDGRAWWLLVAAVVLVTAAAFVMAVRSPARTRLWQHALHMAVALVLTVLTVCLLVRLYAHYGLSLLGIGDLGGDLAGEVALRPNLWPALGLAALWGLVTGPIGGLLAARVHRRGQAPPRSQ
ncbi:streptophobe family protein [Streptomyces peucetius]|uniref:Streptophobe family protein n=1 Tax=Streptomyces peucetius TaxID=1950 RepID=A0ABY6I0H7_STRPE|nr:streptophobe family protein [Streptomyces peucetius]UYQ60470.1 streptophobe family protein [Streptomyces peucetius]